MRKRFISLFLLIGLFLMAYVPEENNEIKKNKMPEILNQSYGWGVAEASYYDPMDSSQTKENPDGIGAFGRKIESGSISLGFPLAKYFRDEKKVVFIEVKNFDIITPYGRGIFRVDDMLTERYQKDYGKYYIDFSEEDLSSYYKKLGRFKIRFRYLEIKDEGSL